MNKVSPLQIFNLFNFIAQFTKDPRLKPITKAVASTSGVLQKFLNAHFNLTDHFRDQLQQGTSLHKNDSTILSSLILSSCGESSWMRKYADTASKKINDKIRKEITKPASDYLLMGRESFNENLIKTTLELERKRRRFPLRELSMCNVFSDKDVREELAEYHCTNIVGEANKILGANLRNLVIRNGGNKNDVENLMNVATRVGKDDASRISHVTVSNQSLGNIKEHLLSHDVDPEPIDVIFEDYQDLVKEAESKRVLFQSKIDEMQDLEDEHGKERLGVEYAKVRLLYSVEWLARAKMVGFTLGFSEGFEMGGGVASNSKDLYSRNMDESLGELKMLFGKQVATTAIGASINSKTRNKDGTNGAYLIACDTEFHDYIKFFMRPILTFVAGVAAVALAVEGNEDKGVTESLARDVARTFGRFLSGSHIGMRVAPEEVVNILAKVADVAKDGDVGVLLKSLDDDVAKSMVQDSTLEDKLVDDNPSTECLIISKESAQDCEFKKGAMR